MSSTNSKNLGSGDFSMNVIISYPLFKMADSDKDDPDSVYHDPKEIINAWSLMDDFQVRKDDLQNDECSRKN